MDMEVEKSRKKLKISFRSLEYNSRPMMWLHKIRFVVISLWSVAGSIVLDELHRGHVLHSVEKRSPYLLPCPLPDFPWISSLSHTDLQSLLLPGHSEFISLSLNTTAVILITCLLSPWNYLSCLYTFTYLDLILSQQHYSLCRKWP